jgi:polar amino acid transport system permease protein
MVPAMMSQLTTIIKDTSLVATIGVAELVRQGRILYTQFFNPIEVFLFIGAIYFVICFGLSQASRRLELGRQPKAIRDVALRDLAA